MVYLQRICLILCAALLIACGSKINQENFNKIENGMSYQQVIELLGDPSSSESYGLAGISGTKALWSNEKQTISIAFINKKVRSKDLSTQ